MIKILINIKKSKLLSIVILTFLLSCKSEINNEKKVYYYNAFSEKDNISAYYKRVCTIVNETFRVDSIFRYNLDGKLTETSVEHYNVSENKLLIIFDYKNANPEQIPYLSTINEDCLETKYFFGDSIEVCFLGKEKLSIKNVTYDNSLKFNRKPLVIDGVENTLYFDENFILIREDYKSGFLDYYRIDRVKEKPKAIN